MLKIFEKYPKQDYIKVYKFMALFFYEPKCHFDWVYDCDNAECALISKVRSHIYSDSTAKSLFYLVFFLLWQRVYVPFVGRCDECHAFLFHVEGLIRDRV